MQTRRFGSGAVKDSPAVEFSVDLLRRDGTRFATEIAALLREEVDGLERLPPDLTAELVAADLERAVSAISAQRSPNEDELAASAVTAANLARRGIPMETVLRARRTAIRRACELLQEAGVETGLDSEAQLECFYRLWEWSDAIQAADAEAHRIAELEMTGNGIEQRERFVRVLLTGGLSNREISSRASAYGLLPGSVYMAFRARPTTRDGFDPLSGAIAASGNADGFEVLTATIDGDLCGVLRTPPRVTSGGVVGLGMEIDLIRLSASFEAATRALETAVAFSYEGVVTLDDLSLRPAIIAEGYLGERLVGRYLDPLRELGEFGSTLEDTVRSYFEHGMRIDETAKALFVHPNTLRHRLDRFQQTTGADLRHTEDMLEVWWALERRRLDSGAAGAPDA